jgi:Asp-tRNA(Asn)/Glu-tRNA(Gln) amidotransferase A subunit family amidase
MDVYLSLLIPIVGAGLPEEVIKQFRALRESDLAAVKNGAGLYSGEAYRVWATASEQDILAQIARRKDMKDALHAFYAEGWQAVLAPISIVLPFHHLQQPAFNARTLDVDGATVPYMTMLCWISLATAMHGPALAVPAGQTDSGLPTGVQLVGPCHGEDRLFDLAAAIEEGLGGFQAPPI